MKKIYTGIKLILVLSAFFFSFSLQAQTTVYSGNWSSASNWSTGSTPASTSSSVTVSVPMALDQTLTVNSSGSFDILAAVSSSGTQSLTMTTGTLNVEANMTISGSATLNGGTIHIYPGYTLTINGSVSMATGGMFIIIDEGASLVTGSFSVSNGSGGSTITDNGTFTVNGNFSGGTHSIVQGIGQFTASGKMTTGGGELAVEQCLEVEMIVTLDLVTGIIFVHQVLQQVVQREVLLRYVQEGA